MDPAFQSPGRGPARRENLWIAAVMAAILFLASLPQLRAWLTVPGDLFYTGLLRNNLDALSYLAKIRQGIEGRWLYENRYTTEPHPPALLFTFYLLLGHIARIAGLAPPVIYQIARVAFGLFLLFSADHLIRALGWRGLLRGVALCLVFLGSGLGWIGVLFGGEDYRPVELTLTEGYCYQSMANYPHFAFATSCMLWMIAGIGRFAAGSADGRRSLAAACAASFVLAWVHPRLLLTVGCTGLIAAALSHLLRDGTDGKGAGPGAGLSRWIVALVAITLAAAGPAIATLRSLGDDPVWAQTARPVMTSPMPAEMLVGYGLLWPLAAFGGRKLVRDGGGSGALILAWLIAGLVLPYAPYDAQRRLWQGYDIPLALAAAWSLASSLRGVPVIPRVRIVAIVLAVAACSVGTFVSAWSEARRLSLHKYPNFVPRERIGIMRTLEAESARGETVLGALMSGVVIPSFTSNRVVVGHWAETFDEVRKERLVGEFFDAATDPVRRDEIADGQNAAWLIHSPFERELGKWDPAGDPAGWREVAREGEIVLYRRVPED